MLTWGKADWKSATWQFRLMLAICRLKPRVSNCCSSQIRSPFASLLLMLTSTLYLQSLVKLSLDCLSQHSSGDLYPIVFPKRMS